MINITVTGNSLGECHQQLLAVAEEVQAYRNSQRGQETSPSLDHMLTKQTEQGFREAFQPLASAPAPSAAPVHAPAAPGGLVPGKESTATHDVRGVPFLPDVHSATREITAKLHWRKRRGVDDTQLALAEAPYIGGAIGTALPQAPAQVFQQPAPVAPPAPTTAHRVAMPESPSVLSEMNLQPQAPAQAAMPVMPQFTQPAAPGVYTLETFKPNIVSILNKLADEGKIDHTWINQTKVSAFGGKEIYDWASDHVASQMLFDTFIKYKFINA